MSDQLEAMRHNAMQSSFGERLAKQERKILTNMLKKINSTNEELTGQEALIGLSVINELRKLQNGMGRDTLKAIQELEENVG